MSSLKTLEVRQWRAQLDDAATPNVIRALEAGSVLLMPHLAFELAPGEQRFLSPRWSDGKAKNISYDPPAGQIRHTSAQPGDRAELAQMMARFAGHTRELVAGLCPRYADHLRWGLTSFRPHEVAGRETSPRKDDTRVHVDAFASRPTQGQRILRVFYNVNPHGKPRVWEIGEPLGAVAQRFRDRVSVQWPGSAWLLERLHVTRGRRSPYDHIMLNLHDQAKLDENYQKTAQKTRVEFPAHSTWMVFTDRVMHAALAGQYLLEQTFYLPVAAMQDERHAPLRVLEQIYQRKLA